tara:strand:- start:1671 stop:2948 length:1278 start_codon:yes stop_codon:yes gene_type:complete
MKKISFIINTSINTRDHVELLLKSLHENLYDKEHEILVFVDDDNEGTTEYLINQKKNFYDLKVITHKLSAVVGYCRNINLLVEYSKHNIVSYLQSDMVISKNYDLHIINELEENSILCPTRIEPPLHPAGPEKIIKNFGLEPKEFQWDNFLEFASNIREDKVNDFFFVPFSFYKKLWIDIGGYDTLFRRSREDSDLPQRLLHKGIKIKQSFNLNVYHFTCVSSRGKNWFMNQSEIQDRVKLQNLADKIEVRRFIRKWGRFEHGNNLLNKLDIDLVLLNDTIQYSNFIYQIEPYFSKVWLNNNETRLKILEQCDQEHNFANRIMNFTNEQWELESKFYNIVNYNNIFKMGIPKDYNVKITLDLKEFKEPDVFLSNIDFISDIINKYEMGKYELGCATIEIKNIINISKLHINTINPPFDYSLINVI